MKGQMKYTFEDCIQKSRSIIEEIYKDGYQDILIYQLKGFIGGMVDTHNKMIKELQEEIQQYRAIGTVEDIQLIFSLCKDLEIIVKKYEAIGTIEEFKALKENQRKCEECAGCTEWMCDCANVRDKTIDEFAERLKEKAEEIMQNPDIMLDCKKCTIWKVKDIDEIAEEMRGAE